MSNKGATLQRWQDELAKHPIHTILNSFQEQVERDIGTIDPVQEMERVRFAKVTRMMQRVIADLDPELAPTDTLNQLINTLQNHGVTNTIATFAQSPNPGLFQQANNQINPSLSYVYQLASLKSARIAREVDVEVASSSFELFAEATKREYDKISASTSAGLAKIDSATAEIATVSDKAKAIESAINAKLSELESRSNSLITQQSTDFSTAQSKRQTDFLDLFASVRTEADQKSKAIFLDLNGTIEKAQKSTDEKVSALLHEAEEKHKAILELYNLSAKDSVSGGYQSFADREYSSAEFWRYVTIGSAVVALLWVGASYFYFTPGDEPDRVFWIKLAKSVSITALLLSIAVYASRQSTLHRFNERRARTFSLQVQAFDPFIASLPGDMQDRLKEEMSKRIFGSDDHELQNLLKSSDFESLDKATWLSQVLPLLIGKK